MREEMLQKSGIIFRGRVDSPASRRILNLLPTTLAKFCCDLHSRQAKTLCPQPLDGFEPFPIDRTVHLITPAHGQQLAVPLVSKRIKRSLAHTERTANLSLKIRLVFLSHDSGEHERKPFRSVSVFVMGTRFKGDWRVDQVCLVSNVKSNSLFCSC